MALTSPGVQVSVINESFYLPAGAGTVPCVIIATAHSVAKTNQDKKVVVVSRDINMRVISDAIGLQSESYEANQVIADSSELYSGVCELVVDVAPGTLVPILKLPAVTVGAESVAVITVAPATAL